ncbi:RxLR effector [Phytophthora palmivora]|uniref:RxLR effector protein n=1 Tax=Phytophthora palmivora TaxID=4796 RepID=A0A2P4X4Y6_9STRA|nr:RxLR effector [Phytophthora palmivora]
MRHCVLLLVLALVVLASSDVVAIDQQSKALSTAMATTDQDIINGKRMLRVSDGTRAIEEERGMTEVGGKLRMWAKSFKKWITNSKFVQIVQKMRDAWVHRKLPPQEKRVYQVKRWMKQGMSDFDLYRKGVTLDEYYKALDLDPKFRMFAESPAVRRENPGMDKFYTYMTYFEYMRAYD